MSKETGIIFLGVFVAILPFLGFPQTIRDILFSLSGIGLLALGLFLRADHLKREAGAGPSKGAPPIEAGPKNISDIASAE